MDNKVIAQKVIDHLHLYYTECNDISRGYLGRSETSEEISTLIRREFSDDLYAEHSLVSIEETPYSLDVQTKFKEILVKKIDHNPDLAILLLELLEKAYSIDTSKVSAEGERSIAIGGDVVGSKIYTGNVMEIYVQQPRTKIHWSLVKQKSEMKCQHRLDAIGKRINDDLYVHRESIHKHVTRFLESEDKKFFVLVGGSGMGKSAFLWGLCQELRQDPKVSYLFCDATIALRDRQSAVEALLGDLADALGIPYDTVLYSIDPGTEYNGQTLVFIIDALNEFHRMTDIESILEHFHSRLGQYPWMKMIFSCRPNFWNHIANQLGSLCIAEKYFYQIAGDGEMFVKLGLPDQKEMAELYNRYRMKYRFEPRNIEELDVRIQRRIREPLMLWLISEVCISENISDKKDLILLDTKAIPAYIARLQELTILSRNGEDQEFLEDHLPELFVESGICRNYVSRTVIIQHCEGKNIDVEGILRRLINSGILRDDKFERLSFCFERFYGYYLGLHLRKIAANGQQIKCV